MFLFFISKNPTLALEDMSSFTSCGQFPDPPHSRITRSTTTSREQRDPRGRRTSWVRNRRKGEQLGEGVCFGDFPFGFGDVGEVLAPDIPILLAAGRRRPATSALWGRHRGAQDPFNRLSSQLLESPAITFQVSTATTSPATTFLVRLATTFQVNPVTTNTTLTHARTLGTHKLFGAAELATFFGLDC